MNVNLFIYFYIAPYNNNHVITILSAYTGTFLRTGVMDSHLLKLNFHGDKIIIVYINLKSTRIVELWVLKPENDFFLRKGKDQDVHLVLIEDIQIYINRNLQKN